MHPVVSAFETKPYDNINENKMSIQALCSTIINYMLP